jgi:hypothetical protein
VAPEDQVIWIVELVEGDQDRPNRPETREGLGQAELRTGASELLVAFGQILTDSHPRDVAPRVVGTEPMGVSADHYHQLDLPVDEHVAGGEAQLAMRGGDARRELCEDHRLAGCLGPFLVDVPGIVQPDAEHLRRSGYRSTQLGEFEPAAVDETELAPPLDEVIPPVVDALHRRPEPTITGLRDIDGAVTVDDSEATGHVRDPHGQVSRARRNWPGHARP